MQPEIRMVHQELFVLPILPAQAPCMLRILKDTCIPADDPLVLAEPKVRPYGQPEPPAEIPVRRKGGTGHIGVLTVTQVKTGRGAGDQRIAAPRYRGRKRQHRKIYFLSGAVKFVWRFDF